MCKKNTAQDATCEGNSPVSSGGNPGGLSTGGLSWPLQGDVGSMPRCQNLPLCHMFITPEPWDMGWELQALSCSRDGKSGYDKVLVIQWFHCLVSCRCCSVSDSTKRQSIPGTVQVLALPLAQSFMFCCCSSGAVSKNKPASFLFSVYFIWPSLCIIAVKVQILPIYKHSHKNKKPFIPFISSWAIPTKSI